MNMLRKIQGIFICLVGAVCVYGQTAKQLVQQAKKTTQEKQRLILLNQAILLDPRCADAYHNRADMRLAAKQYEAALADYTRVISLRPRDPFRYYARALAYLASDKPLPAIADLTKAISLKPSYADFYLARGRAYLKAEKYESARLDFVKYRRFREPAAAVLVAMLPAYVSSGHYDEAQQMARQALARGEDGPEVHYWLGRALLGEEDLDEAVSHFSKAINRDETYAAAYRYRANAFKEMGELEACVEDYTRLVALQPEAIFYNRRGLIYEELGKYDLATADYTQALELSPKWSIPYNNRGYVNMRLKNWAQAKKDLETAISLDGSVPTPYVNLAGVYWSWKKDRKRAYQNLDKALRRGFKDVASLYDETQKGWMFKGLNHTTEFRALMYN